MIERYRLHAAAQALPRPVRRRREPPAKAKSTANNYGYISREILLGPPLRHRGQPAEAGLSVFEFCVGVAAIILARRSRAADAHRAGLRAGKKAILAKRASARPVRDKAEFSPREQFDFAGSAGFDAGRRKFYRQHATEDVSIEVSRNELLRCAGLSEKADHSRRVPDALDQLTRAVRSFPPILADWEVTSSRRLKLTVRHEWLTLRRYARVTMPLPTSGPVVLALNLFLFAIDPRPRGTIGTPAEKLYGRLGIRLKRPAHNERALRQALALVNAHRGKQGLPEVRIFSDGKGGWRFSAERVHPVESDSSWAEDDEIEIAELRYHRVCRREHDQREQDRELFRGFNQRLRALR